MKIKLFLNRKGLLFGDDPRRVLSEVSGELKIGNTVIAVDADKENILPSLFYGASGDFPGTFTEAGTGTVYDLGRIPVRAGRPTPPSDTAVELMELTLRADSAERERDALREEISELQNIFDTNSLNFIINGKECL